MRVEELSFHVRGRPFRPFRVHVSDGSVYGVIDAHNILVTRTAIMIGIDLNKQGIPRRGVYVDPVHITRIEPLQGENGEALKRS